MREPSARDRPSLSHRRQLRRDVVSLLFHDRVENRDRLGEPSRDLVRERLRERVVRYRPVHPCPRRRPLLELHLRPQPSLDLRHMGRHLLRPAVGELARPLEVQTDLDPSRLPSEPNLEVHPRVVVMHPEPRGASARCRARPHFLRQECHRALLHHREEFSNAHRGHDRGIIPPQQTRRRTRHRGETGAKI